MAEYPYRAFISYSHADEKWASWLHRALETYRVPKYLVGEQTPVGEIPAKLGKVFRDREELASSSSLGTELTNALEGSACQIVICSPNAAKSHWTNEEILTYKRLGREDRIFCLIVDGEPGSQHAECFPPALNFRMGADGELSDVPAEPIAADARAHGDGKQNALLKLIAGILGVGFDQLKQREAQRRHRRLMAITAAASVGMVITSGLAGYAIIQRDEAEAQRERAEIEAETARRTTEFMVGMFEVSDPSEARGNTITVREILDTGAQRIDRELVDQPVIQATLMQTIGDVYESLGLYAESGDLLQKALDLRRAELGNRARESAETMADLAKVLSLQAEYESAEPLYRDALATQRELLGNDSAEVAETLTGLADLLTMNGQYEEAEGLFRESLEARLAVYGDRHLEVAKGIEFLGMNMLDQGRHDEAEKMLRDAIALQKSLLNGSPHPDLADSLNNLAVVLWDASEYEEVEALYREALAMSEALYDDENHPAVSATLNNLAFMLHDKGDYEAAEESFREVIRIRRQSLGEEHPEVASSLTNLAFLLYDKGDHTEAIKLANESLEMAQRIFPDGHQLVSTTLTNLGRWYIDAGDFAEAENLLRDSLAMQHRLLGYEHPRVAVTETELARLYLSTGRYIEAASAANEARLMLAETLAPDHWRTGWAGIIEGAALTHLQDFATAESLLTHNLELVRANPSAGVSRVDSAQRFLADLYSAWGKPERAAEVRARSGY